MNGGKPWLCGTILSLLIRQAWGLMCRLSDEIWLVLTNTRHL